MKQSFEDYLKDVHAMGYVGNDDDMPDAYADWVAELGSEDMIQYAEEWMQEDRVYRDGEFTIYQKGASVNGSLMAPFEIINIGIQWIKKHHSRDHFEDAANYRQIVDGLIKDLEEVKNG